MNPKVPKLGLKMTWERKSSILRGIEQETFLPRAKSVSMDAYIFSVYPYFSLVICTTKG